MNKIKKYIWLFVICIILSSCDKKQDDNDFSFKSIPSGVTLGCNIHIVDYYENDIHYKIFTWDTGIFVINMTKDSLEISNLDMQ